MKPSHILIPDIYYIVNCIYVYYVLCVGFPHWASSSPPHSALSFVLQVPGGGSADFPRDPRIPLPGIVRRKKEFDWSFCELVVYKTKAY